MNPKQSARNIVYPFLHKKIVDMQIMPGAVINPLELAEFLNVSRSPVRDALMQLEKEFLVETAPKKGTYVSKIDVQRVADERFMRACIEEKVAVAFMNTCTEEDLKKLEDNLLLQKEAFRNRDTRTFLQLDDDFHAMMYEATNHIFCQHAIANFSGHYHRIRLLSLADPDICADTIRQHEEIMNLLRTKQGEELQKKITSHICEKGTEVEKHQKRYPSLFTSVPNENFITKNIWDYDFLADI